MRNWCFSGFFIVVIFVSVFLRFWNLGSVPQSLNADEVAIGYNAYSILKTGKDEYGQRFPLAFRSFDDYKTPLYIYLAVPSVGAFGLTPFAVRFPSAVMGVVAVIATYVLVRELTRYLDKEKTPGVRSGIVRYLPILSAALLAISPWHLQFSRSAYEASTALTFIVIGSWALLAGLRNGWGILLSAGVFALSFWSYHTPRVFVPMLLLGYAVILRRELFRQWKFVVIGAVLGLAAILPVIRMSMGDEVQMRARGVSSISDPAVLERSVAWVKTDAERGIPLAGVVHNRRIAYAMILAKGYFEHLDPSYFFLEKVRGKYHAPGVGLLYLWELPFILIGLYVLAGTKGRFKWLLAWWILMAPVAASPTLQLPHPVRTLVFLPMLGVITAAGLAVAAEWIDDAPRLKRVILFGGIGLVIVGNIAYYLHQYYVHLNVEYAEDWQYGRREAALESQRLSSGVDTVLVSPSLDMPYAFWLFHLAYDPATYLAEGGTVSGGFKEERNRFGKFRFRSLKEYVPAANEKVLCVGTPEEVFKNAIVVSTVRYPSGDPAFVLFIRNNVLPTKEPLQPVNVPDR